MNTPSSSTARLDDRVAGPALSVLHVRIAVKELGIAPEHLIGSCAGAEPTHFADAPELVGGLSFAGRPVPVIDLRVRYGLPAASPGPLSRTLILDIDGRWIGLVVDSVFGVVDLRADELRAAPDCEAVGDSGCINGLARRVCDGVPHDLILVDIACLIGRQALERIAPAPSETGALPA